MKMFLHYFIVAASLPFVAFAADDSAPPVVSRINELIPDTWIEYPAIEPAIPSDYVMEPNDDGISILWGTESDLENFKNQNTSNFSNGVFVLKHSMEHQTGPNSFSFNKKDLIKEYSKVGLQVVRAGNGQWGEYPTFFYEGNAANGEVVRSLWIGLNSPEKWVLVISMMPTNNKMNDERLWNRFLNNTKQLTGYEYFRSVGSDMKDGCTTYSCAMGVVEARVQQRKKDKKLAIKVTPMNSNTIFTVQKTVQATMMGPWRHGDKLTKIYGTMIYEDGNYKNVINSVINVFTEDVAEFTIKPNQT